MARVRVWSSFVVTLGVLAFVVAFSLWNARAQAQTTADDTTLVSYLPVASLGYKEVAAVHVVNLGRDANAPPEQFSIMFVGANGLLLRPEQACNVGVGETCTATLLSQNCPGARLGGVCRFRAIVVGQEIPCVIGVPPAAGDGEWQANMELLLGNAISKYVAGGDRVLRLPTESSCTPGPDTFVPPPDAPGVDAFVPPPDAPGVDAFVPPPDAPSVDAFVPPPDAPSVDAFVPPPDAPGVDAFVPPPDAPSVDAAIAPTVAPRAGAFVLRQR